MSRERLHDIYQESYGSGQPSVVKCFEKLCKIHLARNVSFQATYTKRNKSQKECMKLLRKNALETLHKSKNKAPESFPGCLLSHGWTEETVVHATSFRMRMQQRRCHDAERLEKLAEKLLEDGDDFLPVLRLLLCLSNLENVNQKGDQRFLSAPNREDIAKIVAMKGPLYAGDYPYNIFHASYTLFPCPRVTGNTLEDPLLYPTKNSCSNQDPLHAKQYTLPDFSAHKYNGNLYGLKSAMFGHQGLTNSSYEFDSVSRLYGGLRHSRTSTLDITMSYPKLNGPIDMLGPITSSLTSIDEGFVSPSSSIEFSLGSDMPATSNSSKTENNEFSHVLLPYHGYRFPDYDLNVWKDCLHVEKNYHRTWETLGLPAGSTIKKLYLTEAGSEIFDLVWQQRAKVIFELASFFHGGNTALNNWKKVDEENLIKNSILVMMGVASQIFEFNKLGQMFLPCKNVYFSGVDPEALHGLLSEFSEWGTCFWRLLHFSTLSVTTETPPQDPYRFLQAQVPAAETEKERKGVIYKAFAGAVHAYLLEYQRQILAMDTNKLTLQKLTYKIKRAGAQIRYICQLCKCGTPDMPVLLQGGVDEFPTGVALLSYLFEEAVYCPEPNHYLALLYLLRKSCLPYLQFVQDWVFRGKCWDSKGEFMLRINADFGGARKDRQRWLKYVEPVNPDDPGSCVPSFLSPLANDIYTCGKTVALLQLLCPEHFLGVSGVDSPNLEITFSRRKLRTMENAWQRHADRMRGLEKDRIKNWLQKEAEMKKSALELAVSARKAAEEERVKLKEAIKQNFEERDKEKRKEFQRLKKQAEDDAKRRAQERKDEFAEDVKREENRKANEAEKEREEERILQQEKQSLISYYEELNSVAEKRIRLAKWLTSRHRLHSERISHARKQKIFWENEIQRLNAPDRLKESLSEIPPEILTPKKSVVNITHLGQEQDAFDEMLGDFVTGAASSEAEPTKIEREYTDLEKALNVIHGTGPPIEPSLLVPGHPVDRAEILRKKPHVSKESSENFTQKPHLKMVDGKNIADSNLGTAIGSTVLPGVPESPIFKFSVQAVQGKNISDSSIGHILGGEAPQHPHIITPQIRVTQEDSTCMGKIMGWSDPTPNTVNNLKKRVPGKGVTDSTVGQLMNENNIPVTPLSPQTWVPDSTVGDIIYGAAPETVPFKSSRAVEGHSVWSSSVSGLLNPSKEDFQIKTDKERVPAAAQDSTVQNLLYGSQGHLTDEGQVLGKKRIEGKHISDSCIGDMMRLKEMSTDKGVFPNKDINELRKFALNNQGHGGHHSKSTIQDLMYYDDSKPMERATSKSQSALMPEKVCNSVELKPSVNSPRFHPSYSTVQLLMYPSEEITEEEFTPVEKTFHLQLPPMDAYFDEMCLYSLSNKQHRKKLSELKPMDPIGNVIGKSLMHLFEDDIVIEDGVDWRSDIDAIDMHALPVLLSHCVLQPIINQVALVNRCIVSYFMVDLELPRHFEMLRHFCFLEDGEFSQLLCTELFEKIHSGCRPIELLNPIALNSLISQAIQGSAQRKSPHAEKLTFTVQHLPAVFSTSDPSSMDCFALKYAIGWPCNIVVNESCDKRYALVFGFLLKLKHIMWCLHDVGSKVTSMGLSSSSPFSNSELRCLHLYRHEMLNFIKVMQGYVSTQVVHVCWHEFQDSLKNVKCLDDIHAVHIEYLRRCVFRCLLTKKTSAIMNVITDVFKTILRFWTQISSKSVSFGQLKTTYTNFRKYSTFLFKVVTKLVDRGYQPHLEDFLIRLNFNGFYNE